MDYYEHTGDTGKGTDFTEAAQVGQELLRLAREWRERLGTDCGLLDQYLAGVLRALIDTTNARNAAEEGFDKPLSDLRVVLRQIKEGNEDAARRHPFYPQVKAYMDAHPFPQDALYYETYCVGLFAEYATFAAKQFTEDCNTRFQAAREAANLPQIREALYAAGITTAELDKLHGFLRAFMFAAPSAVFMQGMTDQIIQSLILRDEQSGRYIFNRLLDGEI